MSNVYSAAFRALSGPPLTDKSIIDIEIESENHSVNGQVL